GHGNGESTTRSALSDHHGHHRHSEIKHSHDAIGDRLALPALLGVNAGVSSGSAHKSDNRQRKAGRHFHQANRLAISLRLGHAEIPVHFFLGASPLLLPNHKHGLSAELG